MWIESLQKSESEPLGVTWKTCLKFFRDIFQIQRTALDRAKLQAEVEKKSVNFDLRKTVLNT